VQNTRHRAYHSLTGVAPFCSIHRPCIGTRQAIIVKFKAVPVFFGHQLCVPRQNTVEVLYVEAACLLLSFSHTNNNHIVRVVFQF
jgi:hypothetical protein